MEKWWKVAIYSRIIKGVFCKETKDTTDWEEHPYKGNRLCTGLWEKRRELQGQWGHG